jgi:hypothetical protein
MCETVAALINELGSEGNRGRKRLYGRVHG